LFLETPVAVYELRENWPQTPAASPPATATARAESGGSI
jgi:hypothetical protein